MVEVEGREIEAKNKEFYEATKRKIPNWIGFSKDRCSYNPEISDRINRIRKVFINRHPKIEMIKCEPQQGREIEKSSSYASL